MTEESLGVRHVFQRLRVSSGRVPLIRASIGAQADTDIDDR
jgi:hypothetical protein